jgi:hypothetical protein
VSNGQPTNKWYRDPTWVTALVAILALFVAVLALLASSIFSYLSYDATVTQIKLERAPVLTEACSLQEVATWDRKVMLAPNATMLISTRELPGYTPPLRGNHVLCTIVNNGRLPAIRLNFKFGYSFCPPLITKPASLYLPVVAAGGTVRVLVINMSAAYSMEFQPLWQTDFIVPPTPTPTSYTYPGMENEKELFQLNSTPLSGSGNSSVMTTPAYCIDLLKRSAEVGAAFWLKREQSFHTGERVTVNVPANLPIGYFPKNRCPKTAFPEPLGARWAYALPGKRFTIVRIGKDLTMATIRGPDGGFVCARTESLEHSR